MKNCRERCNKNNVMNKKYGHVLKLANDWKYILKICKQTETANSAQGIGVGKSAIRNVKVVKEEKSSIHVHKSSSYLWFEVFKFFEIS